MIVSKIFRVRQLSDILVSLRFLEQTHGHGFAIADRCQAKHPVRTAKEVDIPLEFWRQGLFRYLHRNLRTNPEPFLMIDRERGRMGFAEQKLPCDTMDSVGPDQTVCR